MPAPLLLAAIPAVAGLMGGAQQAAAAKRAAQEKAAADLQMAGYQGQIRASENQASGSQAAFQNMMNTWAKALGK